MSVINKKVYLICFTSQKRAMVWSEAHDKFLCREVIAVDPFSDTKRGTVQRSGKWSEIAWALMSIKDIETPFRVDKRSVRDRYNLLADRFRRKLKAEEKASGIDTQMSECERALELIIEKEDASEELQKENDEIKRKKFVAERTAAEEARKRAMEKLSTTQKRKKEEGDKSCTPKKTRSGGNEIVMFLKKKSEEQIAVAKAEMEFKDRQLEGEAKRHADMLAMLQRQQQLQMQSFQMIMAQQQQQQQQFQQQQADLMMKLFEKVSKTEK